MQILLDDNNFIQGFSIVGGLGENGVKVENIPQNVQDDCHRYKYIDGQFIYDSSLVDKNNQIELLQKETQEIQLWLKDNDWKFNKITSGEWQRDDERWLSYLEERAIKRARQDEINDILDGDANG